MIDKAKLTALDDRIATALAKFIEATNRRAPLRECSALDDVVNNLRVERVKIVEENRNHGC